MILLKNKNKKANIKIGNNIEIKDGNDFPFDLTLYGKSTQETTQGKQLFNYEDTTMVTDGITVDEDGWITATFDNTNGTGYKYLNFYTNNLNLKNSTTYSIVSEIKSVSGTGFLIPVSKTNTTPQTGGQFNSEVSYNFATLTNNMIKIETPTTIDDFSTTNYGLRTLLQFAKGQSGSITFRLSVLEDTSVTADTFVYEKFTGGQPSPSPDYPSPIESVGRKNLFDYTKLNNENTVQWKAYENLGTVFRALPIYVGANKQIYFSSNIPALTTENAFYAINNINEGSSNILNVDNPRVISSNSDGYVYLGVVTNRQYYSEVQSNEYWIMISTDNVEYLPYEHTEISATVTGKNLFNIPKVWSFTANKDLPFSLPAGTYHFTTGKVTKGGTADPVLVLGNFPVFLVSNMDKIVTFENDITTYGYYSNGWSYANSKDITSTVEDLMISLNGGEYEQYKSNSLTIDLQGNELCNLPDGTKDEVNITNGEALLIKRVGKVVLDGSESWSITTPTHDGFTRYIVSAPAIKGQNLAISSHFIVGDTTSTSVTNLLEYRNTNYIFINTDIASALEDFKTWLSTHNVEVLYELAEPETINLGAVEMPHTYDGVSNITNSADTEMVVKYYKKFEFDKILRSGYNIDEQEYEIAKKQMANGKRKKILSSYVDCIIKIDLGLLDNKTYQEYKEQLEDGEYEYWSYKYNQYKKANFILTKPSITTEYAYDDDIGIDDMEITLEKSSDVS